MKFSFLLHVLMLALCLIAETKFHLNLMTKATILTIVDQYEACI